MNPDATGNPKRDVGPQSGAAPEIRCCPVSVYREVADGSTRGHTVPQSGDPPSRRATARQAALWVEAKHPGDSRYPDGVKSGLRNRFGRVGGSETAVP